MRTFPIQDMLPAVTEKSAVQNKVSRDEKAAARALVQRLLSLTLPLPERRKLKANGRDKKVKHRNPTTAQIAWGDGLRIRCYRWSEISLPFSYQLSWEKTLTSINFGDSHFVTRYMSIGSSAYRWFLRSRAPSVHVWWASSQSRHSH